MDTHSNNQKSSEVQVWRHHKNCAIWTVTTNGDKKDCDCAQIDSIFKGSPSVSEAAPEVIWMNPRLAGLHALPEHMRDPDDTVQYARVHQPPEQNLEDKNSVSPKPKAPSHSSVVVEKYNSLKATVWSLLSNNGGVTSTMEGEDTHVLVRREDFDLLDEDFNALDESVPLESDVQKKIAEIRERRAKRKAQRQATLDAGRVVTETFWETQQAEDLDTLLSIIDTLQRGDGFVSQNEESHGQASNSKSPTESESTLVTVDEAARLATREDAERFIQQHLSAAQWEGENLMISFEREVLIHALVEEWTFELEATAPVQPEVSKEQDNAKS